jgi:GTPase SAR1 family protein
MGHSWTGEIQINNILVTYSNYSHYRNAVGALLVYEVTKKSSFQNVQRWLIELKQYAEPECTILLIGNKVDLVDRNNRKREVAYDEAKAFADENNLIFYETSALSSYKINQCFEDLLQEIYNERRKVSNREKQILNNYVKLGTKKTTPVDRKCC